MSTWYGTIRAPTGGVNSSLCESIISRPRYASGVMDAWEIEAFGTFQPDLAFVCKTGDGWLTAVNWRILLCFSQLSL